MKPVLFAGLAVWILLPGLVRAQDPAVVVSPDGNVRITVAIKDKFESADPQVYYSVRFAGTAVLLDSPFGLTFKGAPAFGRGVRIAGVSHRSADTTWKRYWGKRTDVRDQYNEMIVTLEEMSSPGRKVDLVFRAYDDGIGFRYVLPSEWGSFSLSGEHTGFVFPGDPTVWAANYGETDWSSFAGSFQSSFESEFNRTKMSGLNASALYGPPVLIQLAADRWVALTEANLTDWAGMYLAPAPGARTMLTSVLAPRLDEPDVAVRSTAPRYSPWRVLMLGKRAGDLIESDLVQNLNDPPTQDFSWVKPGKSAWDRWWSNSYAPEPDFPVGVDTRSMKYFVDLAAEMHWQYQLVDWYWYGPPFVENGWKPKPGADITKPVPELDLPDLIRYANAKGVDILLWLQWNHVDEQMDKAFPLYEKWGVRGIKIDFMNRDDQEMVNFYHRVIKKAAEHHLIVDFHGAYKPTGFSRTYPNAVTREGIMGNEYSKWSDRITPEHTVTIPFTRGLLGEMDFTPGAWRNRTKETFRTENPVPGAMGTRVNQMAMMVVYESALQVLCDSPYNYHSSPAGTDFLKIVPTTWDDTRVIDGLPADYITVARRSGNDWYLGSMTDWTPRTLDIPLAFLGSGKYRAEIWADAYEAADFPDRLMKQERIVTARDSLKAILVPGGGHVVRLTPAK